MTNPETAKILERVKKLLALGENNSNEAEASVAVRKAYAILNEHGLSMAQARATTIDNLESDRSAFTSSTNFAERPFRWIWANVAKVNRCECFYQRPLSTRRETIYTFVGLEANALAAQTMADFLCKTIIRLANEEALRSGRKDYKFKISFMTGCAARICERLQVMQQEAKTASRALVVLETEDERKNREWMERNDFQTRAARRGKSNIDPVAAHQGAKAGNTVRLAKEIASA